MEFRNTYADGDYADAYAQLEFPGTYLLAYRDLPHILEQHVPGRRALDFGCGAGRSTRFLRRLGFSVVGADISGEMLHHARAADPDGDYRLVADGDLSALENDAFDLILCAFTFDNIPTREKKVAILGGLRQLLAAGGRLVSVVSSPEIYTNEWVSFSTRDFVADNLRARSGDVVRIINTAIANARPVEDILCTGEAYGQIYAAADLAVVSIVQPLGRDEDGVPWVNETRIAPWTIYVLARL